MKKIRERLTRTVALHYFKLVYRSALFLAAACVYIYNRFHDTGEHFGGYESNPLILGIIWVLFMLGMILRLFPAKFESMGCQKQFKKNYIEIPGCDKTHRPQSGIVTFSVFSAWTALNAIIGALYYAHVIDEGILLLICLAYSVCDVICILFFCPFQTWFMKNKCCGSCRIYNWDYAMMFTPLVFIPNAYAWSLLGMALIVLCKWELTYRTHPERFSEKCNKSLSCALCQEKLCHHKKQLRRFLKSGRFNLTGNTIIKNLRGRD